MQARARPTGAVAVAHFSILHSGTTVLLYSRERCKNELTLNLTPLHTVLLYYCTNSCRGQGVHNPHEHQTNNCERWTRYVSCIASHARNTQFKPSWGVTHEGPSPEIRSTHMAPPSKASSGMPAGAVAVAHFSILHSGTIVLRYTRERCETNLHSISNRCLLRYCTNYCTSP